MTYFFNLRTRATSPAFSVKESHICRSKLLLSAVFLLHTPHLGSNSGGVGPNIITLVGNADRPLLIYFCINRPQQIFVLTYSTNR